MKIHSNLVENLTFKVDNCKYFQYVIILISIFFGIAGRFYSLDYQSLWMDELYSVLSASSNSIVEFYYNWTAKDSHPPLYQITLWCWVHIFGNSEVSVRFLSALLSSLALVVFWYGRKVLGRDVAILALIFMALSGNAVLFAQEARQYSMLLFFALCSVILWLKYIQKDIKYTPWGYLIACLLVSFTHYFGVLLIGLQIFYWLSLNIYKKKSLLQPIKFSALYGAIVCPWLVFHFLTVGSLIAANFETQNLPIFNEKIYTQYIRGIGSLVFWSANIFIFFAGVLFAILYLSKANYEVFNRIKDNPNFKPLIFIFLSTILVMSTLAIKQPNVLTIRYLAFLLPILYIVIAIIVNEIFKLANMSKFASGFVFVVGIAQFFLAMQYIYGAPVKEQWREGVAKIVNSTQSNSVIFLPSAKRTIDNASKYPLYISYYLDKFSTNQAGIKKTIKIIELPYNSTVDLNQYIDKRYNAQKFIFLPHISPEYIKFIEIWLRVEGIPYIKYDFVGAPLYELH